MKKKPAPAPPSELSPPLRRFLYFTAAITGGAIMIVEILGAKMLAPYVGTSHFVWTAQIAITLVALAGGYYVGGRLADRTSQLGRLYGCILGAALYLAVTILLVKPVAFACLNFNLPLGTLFASAFLFFVPLALLAMVGPVLVRVLTASLDHVGRNVGRLTAVSTLGSFAGTVLIGYILIPLLPNTYSMFVTSAVLLLICLAYFSLWNKRALATAAITAGITLLLGFWGVHLDAHTPYHSAEELARRNSNFGMLQVLQEKDGSRRYYLNDFLVQNTYDILEKKSFSMFTFMLHDLAVAYTPKLQSALCIGMGVGIVPMHFAQEGVPVDVVEINPTVVDLARQYFGCEPDRFQLTIADGRHFLNQCRKQYDTIILDAFLGDSSPSHLMTREAFLSMARCLSSNGVLVINCFGDFEPGKDFLVASLHKTLAAVFPSVRIHNDRNGGNIFFVASPRPQLQMLRNPGTDHLHPAVHAPVQAAFARQVDTHPDHGRILTDQYNPVEYYDAINREEIRRNLVSSLQRY